MRPFLLHSRGENWFHFRKDLSSAMESFSITFCHDGTVCMTGDYGCLSWRREWFSGRTDYGFPNKETGIGYFAEKVVRSESDQNIWTWNKERAVEEIKDSINDYRYEGSEEIALLLEKIVEEIDWFENGDYGYIQMLEAFNDSPIQIESEVFTKYGRCFTDAFLNKFDMLTSVSDLILRAVSIPAAEAIA